jgi:negative regulator of replication initiation
MVAAQNIVQTLLGTDNRTKSKKVDTTIHHVKQPQLSVRVSMIESLNEEMEIKRSSLSVCCSSFQSLAAAN